MDKRLKDYINYIENKVAEPLTEEEKNKVKEDLLIQIAFFQHERLVHLIVTVTFAVLTMLSVLAILLINQFFLYLLFLLFFVLLVPYIGHYYRLENGVQRLYESYDKLAGLK